jgi:RNA polymerase sigma-70 factor (ECF subfamily)
MAVIHTHTPAELADLLFRTGQGDRQAFAALYQATSAKLFGFALRILTRRDLAEEALQDAFVNIWHHAAGYRPDKSAVITWMTTIVRNRCLDLLRALPPEKQLAEDQTFDEWASDDLSPLEKTIAGREARQLLTCMSQLAPLQRQAIALSYFHGMAHEQLSQHLSQPLGTIKTWIRRGLQVLRSCMGASA